MNNKKIIVQIAEGLGNQLFMYSHAFSLSKKLNYDLKIDNFSGYARSKNLLRKHQKYLLDKFKINYPIVEDDFFINNYRNNFIRKLLINIDKFRSYKKFYIENKNKINGTKIIDKQTIIDIDKLSNKIYVIGNYENQNYFKNHRKKLIDDLTIRDEYIDFKNPLIYELQKSNSVSIHLRRDRFSDQSGLSSNYLINKSIDFTNENINYINKAMLFFNNKLDNPKYYLWTNNVSQINELINRINASNLTLISNSDEINDFHLFKYAKHFIVGPSSFHWWGAWLNENKNKICVRPSNINSSNNLKFWPDEWIPI